MAREKKKARLRQVDKFWLRLASMELMIVRRRRRMPVDTGLHYVSPRLDRLIVPRVERSARALEVFHSFREYIQEHRCESVTVGKFYRMVTVIATAQSQVERNRRTHRWDKHAVVLAVKWLRDICPLHYRWVLNELTYATGDSYSHGHATKPRRTRHGMTASDLFDLASLLWELHSDRSNEEELEPAAGCSLLARQVLLHADNPLLEDEDRANIRAAALEVKMGNAISFHKTREDGKGRDYGHLQNVSKEGKRILFKGTGLVDVDIVNCHPTIANHLSGSLIATILAYVRDRVGFVTQAGDEDFEEAKQDILAVFNGRRRPRTGAGMAFLLIMPEFRRILAERGWGRKSQLAKRGAIFRIFEEIEGSILDSIKSEVVAMGKEWHVPMFDGIICDPLTGDEVVRLEERVLVDTGVAIKLKIKETY